MATQQPSKTTLPLHNRVRLGRSFAIFAVSIACLFTVAGSVAFGFSPLRTAAEKLGFVQPTDTDTPALTNTFETESDDQVLGLATGDPALRFHLPTFFSDVLTAAGLSITGDSVFEGFITVNNDVQINGNLFATNLINSITAGEGLEVTGTGDITIANTDPGSAQAIFKTIKIEEDSITAGANNDTITFLAGDNVELSTDGNEVTISTDLSFSDSDTTYTAGSGLDLTSTTFSLKSALTTVTSITVPNGGIIDLSNITHSSSTPQGLKLPQNTAAGLTAMSSGEGFLAWATDENRVKQFDGSSWTDIATAGGGGTTEWTDAGAYIYPDEDDYLGNNTSGGGNKLAGAYFADSAPLVFGTDNDITTSFASAVLGYSIGSNDINFDSNTLFIDGSADRVGIGTSSPTTNLDVQGSARITGALYDSSNSAGTSGYILASTGNGTQWSSSIGGGLITADSLDFTELKDALTLDADTSINVFDGSADRDFRIYNSDSSDELLFVDASTGRVGIGTTSPGAKLDVVGKTYFRPNTGDATKLLVSDYTGTAARIYTDATSGTAYDLILGTYPNGHTNQLYLKQSNGSVGIGTTSPSYKLDVVGGSRVALTGSQDFLVTDGSNTLFKVDKSTSYTGLYISGDPQEMLDVNGNIRFGDNTSNGSAHYIRTYNNGGAMYFGRESSAGGSIMTGSSAYATFISSEGAYPFQIGVNDATRFTISSAGNVGIGTTSPSYKLDVSGAFRATTSVTSNAIITPYIYTSSTSTALQLWGGDYHSNYGAGKLVLGGRSNGSFVLGPSEAAIDDTTVGNSVIKGATALATATNNLNGGNISIYGGSGAASSVNEANGGNVYLDGGVGYGTGSDGNILIGTNNGNVGIGTTSPAAKLDVIGDIYTSSGLSTFSTAVSDGTIEATQFCTGDGESNCISDFSSIGGTTSTGDLSDMNISSPMGGQVLVYDGTDSWDNRYLTNDILVSTTGAVTIQPNAVALAFDTTGNYVASINAGNGLTSTGSTTGENISHTLYVNTGNGLQISSDAVALGALTADWSQTAAYDIIMNNADAQIQMLESTGGTYYGTIDVGDLSANATYTLSGTSGTILTSANASTVLSGWDTNATDDLLGTNLTSGYLPYYDGDTTLANSTLYTNSTTVGIGTTSPAYLLDLLSTSTSTGALFNGYWNPGSATTHTGDVFRLNLGANASVTGNLFGLYDNGTPLFTVSQSKITSSLPHEFLSAGDVSFAYDAVFTNTTASYITYEGPGHIRTNHPSGNFDLTLSAANAGSVVIADMLEVFTTDPAVYFNTASAGDTDFWAGVIEDASGDDNDIFGIGDGLVVGTNTFFAINSAGNIGIGTTTAAYKLDVNGDVRIASGSDLYIGSIGFNDVGSDRITSGASLIGVYDEFGNSSATTVQDVLDDLDASIAAMATSGQYDRIVAADGSGTDTTIATAISNAAAGDVIFIKAGTYNENVTIDKSLTLLGAGQSAVTVAGSTGSYTMSINGGVDDVIISNMTVTNAGTASTDAVIGAGSITENERLTFHKLDISGGYYSIYTRTAQDTILTEVNALNSASSAFRLYTSDESIIANNTIIGATGVGIFLDTGSERATVVGNYIENTGDDGIYAYGATDSSITGNIINTAGDNGISAYQAENVSYTANTIRSSADVGMFISSGHYSAIGSNTISDSGEDGIYVTGTQYLSITGNTIEGSTENGIEAVQSLNKYISISGNIFTGNTLYGIDVNALTDPTNIIISDNSFSSNGSGSIDHPGTGSMITLSNNQTQGDISQNFMEYFPSTGQTYSRDLLLMNLDGADANSFTGNGLHFIVDQSQVSGYLMLAEDDGGADLFTMNDSGTIYTAGNIGVGSTAPAYAVDVAGVVRATSGFRTNSETVSDFTGTGLSLTGGALGITDDGIDYAQLADSMTLDANYALSQSSYTWTQSYTGTSSDAFSFLADSLTSGNAYDISVDALTSGNAIYVESTSTALTTGSLFNGYWNPGSAATATGDLFKLDIGANATLTGNLFALYDNGAKLFSVSTSKITSALPHEFLSAGDVSFAYDIVMTNQTANFISSYGPMTIVSGESYENLDLTLKAYGTGSVVIDQSGLLMNTGEKLALDSGDNADTYFAHNNAGNYLSVFSDGTESVRFMADGSVDGNTTFDANQFDLAEYYPTLDSEITAGDVVAVQTVDGNDASVAPYLVEKAEASEEQQPVLGVVSTRPGFSLGGGSFRSELCTLVASGSDGEQAARQQLFVKEVTDSIVNDEFTVESLESVDPESEEYGQLVDSAAIELYAQYVDAAELAIPQTRIDTVEDQINTCKALKQVPIALSGRVPVKIDTVNGEIKPGDLLTLSPGETGKAAKAVGPGWVIGRALESSQDNDTVMVFVFTAWYGGGSTVVSNLGEGSVVTAGSPLGSGTISGSTAGDAQITSQLSTVMKVASASGATTLQIGKNSPSLTVDFFNGKVRIGPDGTVVSLGAIQAKQVKATEFTVLGASDDADSSSSLSSSVLEAGETEITIENSFVKGSSKVFITPTSDTAGQVLVVTEKTDGEFTVKIKESQSEDISFDYWIVQSE